MSKEEQLNRVEFYSALNKPNLIGGADRELILTNGLVACALLFTGLTLVTTLVAILLLTIVSYLLKMMAKADPLMRHVFLRQLKYQAKYKAKSTPFLWEK